MTAVGLCFPRFDNALYAGRNESTSFGLVSISGLPKTHVEKAHLGMPTVHLEQ